MTIWTSQPQFKSKRSKATLPLPEKYAVSGTEDAEQIALFMWAALQRDKYPELKWMFAVPNGGSRHKAEAGKLRAMGLKAGVVDICLPVPRGKWPILFIELKRKSDQRANDLETLRGTSPEQKEYIRHFHSVGYAAIVCYGWEHARDTIIRYLEWGNEK